MLNATPRTRARPVTLWCVTLIDFLHYGLVGLVGLAAVATLWFAFYVVHRLHSD